MFEIIRDGHIGNKISEIRNFGSYSAMHWRMRYSNAALCEELGAYRNLKRPLWIASLLPRFFLIAIRSAVRNSKQYIARKNSSARNSWIAIMALLQCARRIELGIEKLRIAQLTLSIARNTIAAICNFFPIYCRRAIISPLLDTLRQFFSAFAMQFCEALGHKQFSRNSRNGCVLQFHCNFYGELFK